MRVYVIQEVKGDQDVLRELFNKGMAWNCGGRICVNEEGYQILRSHPRIEYLEAQEAAMA